MRARTASRTAPWIVGLLALTLLGACGKDEGGGEQATTGYTAGQGHSGYGTQPGGEAGAYDAKLQKAVGDAMAKGRAKLLGAQAEGGGWGDPEIQVPPNVGYTAMAATAVIGTTPSTDVGGDAAIRAALDFLVANQKEDGSIWDNPSYVNYGTSAAIGAFAAAKLSAYREAEVKARDFLARSQIAGDQDDPSYGGFPYKEEEPDEQRQPADLSNLQFALTALHDAGLPQDSEVFKRALVYLDRVQNRSESNTYTNTVEIDGVKRTVKAGDDDGGFYMPGGSKAGYIRRSDGTYEPRSYGSMTYALLKCLVLAGAKADDPRLLGALGWISEHFTVARNPGFESAADAEKAGQQGWFYYAFTVARTLAQYEVFTKKPLVIKDAAGKTHDWRAELAQALLQRQRDDGWWTNRVSDRWEEGAPVLATSYALQALAEINGRFR